MQKRALMGKNHASMSIFSLKNHHGWRDERQLDISQGVTINVTHQIPQPNYEEIAVDGEIVDENEDS